MHDIRKRRYKAKHKWCREAFAWIFQESRGDAKVVHLPLTPPSFLNFSLTHFFKSKIQIIMTNRNERHPSTIKLTTYLSTKVGEKQKNPTIFKAKIVKEHRGSEVTITIYQFLPKSFKQISEEWRFKNRSLTGSFYSLNLALYFNRVKPHQKAITIN